MLLSAAVNVLALLLSLLLARTLPGRLMTAS